MAAPQYLQRLNELSLRLGHLEQTVVRLTDEVNRLSAGAGTAPERQPERPAAETHVVVSDEPKPADRGPSESLTTTEALLAARDAVPPPLPPVESTAVEEAEPEVRPGSESEQIERLVGGRWLAAIGAMAIIGGLAMGVKLAWDSGLLHLSEFGRVIAVASSGLALLGIGEVVRAKWGRAAAGGFFAAGLGALYVAAFASHALYELVPGSLGFVLMAVVCALGIALSLRAGLAWIGVLALLGGYVTPLIAGVEPTSPYSLPAYLAALTGVGVGLSWWQRRFGPLRVLGWAGTIVVGSLWVLRVISDEPWAVLVFVGLVWAGHAADVAFAAHRSSEFPDDESTDDADEAPSRVSLRPAEAFWLVSLLVLAAWATVLGIAAVAGAGVLETWTVPGAMCVAAGSAALIMAGSLRVVRDVPRNASERVGVVLMAISASLLIATIALGVGDWVQAVVWALLGVGATWGGAWARARALQVFGLIVLVIASMRSLAIDSGSLIGVGEVGRFGLVLSRWNLLLAGVACAWIAAGQATRVTRWRGLGVAMGSVGVLSALVALSDAGSTGLALAVAWGVLGLVAVWIGRAERWSVLEAPGLAALLFAIIAWCVGGIADGWNDWSGVGLHPGLWVAFGLALAVVVAHAVASDAWRARGWRIQESGSGWIVAGLLVFVSTSFEVSRLAETVLTEKSARLGAVSIWWGVFAAALLLIGWAAHRAPVRWAGLGLVLLAAAKAAVLDLATVEPAVRVASFLALGLLMVGIGAVYLRSERRRPGSITDQAGNDDRSGS